MKQKGVSNMNTHTHTQQKSTSSILSGKTLAICVGLIALAVAAVTLFKIPTGTVFLMGALLLCPLLSLSNQNGCYL